MKSGTVMNQVIRAEHLNFSYPAQEGASAIPVFEDLDLSIAEGSFVAILGHNGCGKSTLAKHMNAVLLPSGGTMHVFGMNTADEEAILVAKGNE